MGEDVEEVGEEEEGEIVWQRGSSGTNTRSRPNSQSMEGKRLSEAAAATAGAGSALSVRPSVSTSMRICTAGHHSTASRGRMRSLTL